MVCTEQNSAPSLIFHPLDHRSNVLNYKYLSGSQGNGWKQHPDLEVYLQKGETRVMKWLPDYKEASAMLHGWHLQIRQEKHTLQRPHLG